MIDERGNLYLADALIALGILFVAMIMLNSLISLPNPNYSDFSLESKNAQDIMEILSGKVDFDDKTFLSEITSILKENKNSKKAKKEVSQICDEKFTKLGLVNYRFIESNKLNSEVLSSSGDFSRVESLSVATRNFDGYSYTLYLW
jgi:hypothetical protein